jgi:hypothetical protein
MTGDAMTTIACLSSPRNKTDEEDSSSHSLGDVNPKPFSKLHDHRK